MKGRKQFIEILMAQGVAEGTAAYRWKMQKLGRPYTERPKRDLTRKYLEDLGVDLGWDDGLIIEEKFNDCWTVFQNDTVREIYLHNNGNKKYGTTYNSLYVTIVDENGKRRPISLASLIMVFFKHLDIPAGYVVDHIDNNAFNNDPDNLQLIRKGENAKKDNHGHNQYIYNTHSENEENAIRWKTQGYTYEYEE